MKSEGCIFCQERTSSRVVMEVGSVYAIAEPYPVTPGHHLVVPIRHAEDFFSMTSNERRDAETCLLRLRRELMAKDPSITGFNIGINCGKSAGQAVPHAHIHLIPRRPGDARAPQCGVRGAVPEGMKHL